MDRETTITIKTGKRTRFHAWWKMTTGGVLLPGTFGSFLTNVIYDFAETGTASFIFEMKILGALMT